MIDLEINSNHKIAETCLPTDKNIELKKAFGGLTLKKRNDHWNVAIQWGKPICVVGSFTTNSVPLWMVLCVSRGTQFVVKDHIHMS